jgi:protein-S-isoprenylcysteine O-methyltransferase Ste14
MNNRKLKAWVWFVVSLAAISLALFLAAGTVRYWQAWVYVGVVALSGIPLMLYIINDPILLENRTKIGPASEQRPFQKIVVLWLVLLMAAAFIVPGLDRRFGWSNVPPWVSVAGDLLILAAMWMSLRVFKENSFGSATVEVAKGQRVISTGPYAVVRHPMYSSAAVYFIGLSLALGSYWGLIPAVLAILGLILRLFDEERFLANNLTGYTDYCAKVRWRLMPGIF